ncbi:hypothetical protein GGC47_003733 [Bosea sp. OAE752]|jgi:hypothetical protein|uniref:hypothetical protein n=1 Tax=unclassified Bosea (in: a-proteobacteria) TaxID=2653178 RepID=UPI00114E586C
MSEITSEFELICSKSDMAWTALQRQYADRLAAPEIDFLFARLVLGLTAPFYAEREPALHFTACNALVGRKLPPERAHAALRTVPKAGEPWIERAFDLAEEHGTKIAATLKEQRDQTDQINAKADAAHRELSSGAKEHVG